MKTFFTKIAFLSIGFSLMLLGPALIASEAAAPMTKLLSTINIIYPNALPILSTAQVIAVYVLMQAAGLGLFIYGSKFWTPELTTKQYMRDRTKDDVKHNCIWLLVVFVQVIFLVQLKTTVSELAMTSLNSILEDPTKMTNAAAKSPEMYMQMTLAIDEATSLVLKAAEFFELVVYKQLVVSFAIICQAIFVNLFLDFDLEWIKTKLKHVQLTFVTADKAIRDQATDYMCVHDKDEIHLNIARMAGWNGNYEAWLQYLRELPEELDSRGLPSYQFYFIMQRKVTRIVGTIALRLAKNDSMLAKGLHVIVDIENSDTPNVDLRIVLEKIKRWARAHKVRTIMFYSENDNALFNSVIRLLGGSRLIPEEDGDIYRWLLIVDEHEHYFL